MYENYPFWHALFAHCGIGVVLSDLSNFVSYEKALNTVMSDNICFPAKLVHSHIQNLVQKKVDRIFLPYVIYEHESDAKMSNSYNCPIVAGYSDVIRSAMSPDISRRLAGHHVCQPRTAHQTMHPAISTRWASHTSWPTKR